MPVITNSHGFLKKAWPTTLLLFMTLIMITSAIHRTLFEKSFVGTII